MKNVFKLYIVICLALFSSCSDWLDVNTDPNNPTVVPSELVLPNAQMQIAGAINGDFAIIGGLWSQHYAQSHVASQYKDIDSYDITDKDFEIPWTELYSDALVDLDQIRKSATASGEWNSYLQATLLQAYTYQILADFYDKIPFSEALKGEQNATPKWDSGPAVYDGLITMIDEALSKNFAASTVKFVPTDFLFGSAGNKNAQVANWTAFANTLKLKIYLRQTESSRKAEAISKLRDLMNAGGFLSNHAKIDVFTDEANRSNPLYETNVRQLNVATNLRASYTLLSFFEANGDPRLDAYYRPGNVGTVFSHFALAQGDFNELTTTTSPEKTSKVNISSTAPVYFFSKDQVLFMLAEAAVRTGVGNAEAWYYQGIAAAGAKFGVSIPASLTDGKYKYPTGSDDQKIEAIITQKWVGAFHEGYESFFDQNRTGYPRISSVPTTDASYVPGTWTYSIQGVTSGAFPRRLIFPDISRRVNRNTPAFAPVTEKVWWHK